MKTSFLEKFRLPALLCVFGFGCSITDLFKKENNLSGRNPQTNDKSLEFAAILPCENRFHPVKDGSVKNYEMNNLLGKSTAKVVQRYNPGEAFFIEEWTFNKTTLKQVWQCANEGIIAPNYGSMMYSNDVKIESRRISGVMLPPENGMTVRKTRTAVYESKAQMPSGMGKTVSLVTVNDKIVSLDGNKVNISAGAFKTAKVKMNLNTETKVNGKPIPVPSVKPTAWFVPNVGIIKSGLTESK